ncbi:retrotransposon protein, putative, ty1-copia subclass [Tanacetum coccineum]
MLDSESNKWIDAMNAEIQSMMDNMVWVLVDLPPGCKTVGSRWLFKKKTDMDGIVHVYEARLVAKGYTQLYGVDYEETFSPVADIRAIRILISIAAYYDYEIWQMDVKTAFLNGYLDEDIYMVQPEGFVDPNHPRKVCKLQRSIYGLKQASRSWNKRFDEEIKRFGFTQNLDEPCVYQKASGRNVTFLILYVDDIIIMGNHIPSLQSVKDYLGKCFAMKDLGEAAFILGIKIYRDRSKRLIGLCQNAYMDKILKRYKMDNSKRGHIPMQERLDLNKSQGAQTPNEVNRMKNVPYASAVGSIMYAVRCTRPDVAFAQNMTSRFQQNPGEPHWTAVKNILKYLRNTKDMFLVYGGNPSTELRVECYCDAGFETDRDDTKSQTGYVFVLNGGAVDWKSSKQSTTAMSATESEYIAASEAAMEAVWIRKFISGLGIVPTINEPLNMYCDNSAAVHYANEPGVQKGARHYQRRYHYVRECVELGEIRILKVHTDNNLADPFTKALSNRKLTQHARGMGLRPASSFIYVILQILRMSPPYSHDIHKMILDFRRHKIITLWNRRHHSESVPVKGDEPGQPRVVREETYVNTTPENKNFVDAKAEAIHMILSRIGNDIYSTMDACPTAREMWFAIERMHQGDSINIQDVKTKLFWEFVNVQFLQQLLPEWSRFVTIVKNQQDLDTFSFHKLFDILKHQRKVNEICAERIAKNANSLVLVAAAQHYQHDYTQAPKP